MGKRALPARLEGLSYAAGQVFQDTNAVEGLDASAGTPYHPAVTEEEKMNPRVAVLIALSSSFLINPLNAETPRLGTILYGASYYHEYMPYDRLDQDVELMKRAGISLVRLGESTWSSWEPQPGDFRFEWMERILDRLHEAGIRVILGTPTYSIPPWLYSRHPEILVFQLTEAPPSGAEGYSTYPGRKTPGAYGPRQNMDITHPTFRYYSDRIIRQVVGHFRDHPAVIGYQIDNETHPAGIPTPHAQKLFAEYLREKFGTVDRLNRIWGLVYWGQLIGKWTELPPIDGILNPGFKIEWQRFQRSTVTDFLAWQARIVRELKRPDQFVTHNFIGGVRTDIDQNAIAQSLDVAAVNPYHRVQDELDGHAIALSGDLNRSLKHQNYLVTETNAQGIGWDSRGQQPPYDGQLRLSAYSHLASGANLVAYWHWHSLHYGQETYWKGVLSHDLEPNRVYLEVTRIAQELGEHGPRLVDLRIENPVAILYSVDSFQGIRMMRFSDRVDYMTILSQMHRALYELNVGVDFVFPETEDLAKYRVLLVPPLYVASDALLNRLSEYVRAGGHVVMSFKSGFTDEYSTVRWERAPGPLREAAGFSYQEFSSLTRPLPLKGDPFAVGEDNQVSVWAEFLVADSAEALAWYDHPFFGRFPAITRNQHGRGTLTYQGTHLSLNLQKAVLMQVLEAARLAGPDQSLPRPVRVRHGLSNQGKRMHYYLNFSGSEQRFSYTYEDGTDILKGAVVASRSEVTVGPWDLAIIEESGGG